MVGVVKKWVDTFGFIADPDGKDILVPYTEIRQEGFRSLKVGQQVEFEVVVGDRGLVARNVVITHDACMGQKAEPFPLYDDEERRQQIQGYVSQLEVTVSKLKELL